MGNKRKLPALLLALAMAVTTTGFATNAPPANQTSSADDTSAAATASITAISFNKQTDLTLRVGVTNRRYATTTPAGGVIVYASSNPAVASVSDNGTVTTKAPGKTVISAACGDKVAKYNLTVIDSAAGKGGALVGYTVVVYDVATTAERARIYVRSDPTLDEFHFYSVDGNDLGYMYSRDMEPIQQKYKVGTEAPANNGDWNGWFVDQFNLYRGFAATGIDMTAIELEPDQTVDTEALRREVFRLVNIERGKAGMVPLVWDEALAAYAQNRAKESAEYDAFIRPDLSWDFFEGQPMAHFWASGQDTPNEIVSGMMKAPARAQNRTILGDFSEFGNRSGAGCYQGVDGSLHWTLEFFILPDTVE